MREMVSTARGLFEKGLPLSTMVDRRLGTDIELFSQGGLRILKKIEAQDYNVLRRRPHIGKTERAWLLLVTLARRAFLRVA
jgi:phytoene/squalene synthetase